MLEENKTVDEVLTSLRSVAAAVAAHDAAKSSDETHALAFRREHVLQTIRTVAKAVEHHSRNQPTPAVSDDTSVLKSVFEVSYRIVTGRTEVELPEAGTSVSLLRTLGRSRDENLHSDFLAALLDPRKTGDLAKVLFSNLFSVAKPSMTLDPQMICYQVAHREVRLDTLDPHLAGSDLGARRIDILASSNLGILTIENKIDTYESENQTEDYRAVVQARYKNDTRRRPLGFLFLSPSGLVAQSSAFRSLSYRRLFRLLRDTTGDLASDGDGDPGTVLARTYLDELLQIFIAPRSNRLLEARKALEEVGYEF